MHSADFFTDPDAYGFDASVKLSLLRGGQNLPLLIQPAHDGLDPLAWPAPRRAAIEAALRRHGAILLRDFGLSSVRQFEAFAEALAPGLYGEYGDLPKKEGGERVYRSTPYPEQEMILFHNESAHLEKWPRKQLFYCEQAAREGGATPLVDIRHLLSRLPASLADRFEQQGLSYIRTFQPGLDLSWREFFKTDQRREVEQRCQAAGIAYRWLEGDILQTRNICPAVIRHPLTGERAFFNQVQLHHPHSLGSEARDDLIDVFGIDGLPRNVCYGDGTPIEDEVMDLLGRLYEECAVRFSWRQGDVIMLDNMLVAHARDPYVPPRQIVVAMGEMVERSAVWRQDR